MDLRICDSLKAVFFNPNRVITQNSSNKNEKSNVIILSLFIFLQKNLYYLPMFSSLL